jgi:hypothetical protein
MNFLKFTYKNQVVHKNSIGLSKLLLLSNTQIPKNSDLPKQNLVIFSNCHGGYYKKILETHTNICSSFNITYIVSYENLSNFENIKNNFETADILLMSPIINYENYKIENIKKIIKPTCKLIVIPFVRFDGFWMEDNSKKLNKFKTSTVMYFPEVEITEVDNYLENKNIDLDKFKEHFIKSIKKMKQIEDSGDIKFVDYFLKIYKKFPTFRDNTHPTINILNYISHQVICKINDVYNITNNFRYSLQICNEFGHFRPIKNVIKSILHLTYGLDSYYPISRKEYLFKILEYDENENNENIDNYTDFYYNIFNITH